MVVNPDGINPDPDPTFNPPTYGRSYRPITMGRRGCTITDIASDIKRFLYIFITYTKIILEKNQL